jgi:hypothetical protein
MFADEALDIVGHRWTLDCYRCYPMTLGLTSILRRFYGTCWGGSWCAGTLATSSRIDAVSGVLRGKLTALPCLAGDSLQSSVTQFGCSQQGRDPQFRAAVAGPGLALGVSK